MVAQVPIEDALRLDVMILPSTLILKESRLSTATSPYRRKLGGQNLDIRPTT